MSECLKGQEGEQDCHGLVGLAAAVHNKAKGGYMALQVSSLLFFVLWKRGWGCHTGTEELLLPLHSGNGEGLTPSASVFCGGCVCSAHRASLQLLVLVRESPYNKSSIFQNEPQAFRRKKWCIEMLVSES